MVNKDLKLEEILKQSNKTLGEKYPEAQQYLLDIASIQLQSKLTQNQAQEIACNLLNLIKHKDDLL